MIVVSALCADPEPHDQSSLRRPKTRCLWLILTGQTSSFDVQIGWIQTGSLILLAGRRENGYSAGVPRLRRIQGKHAHAGSEVCAAAIVCAFFRSNFARLNVCYGS